MGVPTEETVERRARELALIDGREEVTPTDRQQAWQELHGGHHTGDDDEMLASYSLQDHVAPTLGQQIGNPLAEEPSIAEELVAEGLDEAEHDQMLTSRREVDLPDEYEESEES